MAGVVEKLKRRKGASLAEMLMAVLILLMVTSVVAGGVPAAVNAYHNVIDSANAQVFLSTTVTALRYQLGNASDIKLNEDGALEYHSAITGDTSSLTMVSVDNESFIQLQEYIDYNTNPLTKDEDKIKPRHLVPEEAGTSNLYLECEFPTAKGAISGAVTFKDISVKRKETGTILAKLDTLTITSCINH